jgi:hypothetical protein
MRELNKIYGVNYDINERWEKGIDHDKRSTETFNRISDLDFYIGDDFFCFKQGGDGDNGEHLMYLLDIYFDELDKELTDDKERNTDSSK